MYQENITSTRLAACVAGITLVSGAASAQAATTAASFGAAGKPLQITEAYNFDPLAVDIFIPPNTSVPQDALLGVMWVEVTNTSGSEFVLSDARFASVLKATSDAPANPAPESIDKAFVNIPNIVFVPGESVVFCFTPKETFGTSAINQFESDEIRSFFNNFWNINGVNIDGSSQPEVQVVVVKNGVPDVSGSAVLLGGTTEIVYDVDFAFATSEQGLSQVLFGAEFANEVFVNPSSASSIDLITITPKDVTSEEYLIGAEPEPVGASLFDTTGELPEVVNTNGLLLPAGFTQLNTSTGDLSAIGVESDPVFNFDPFFQSENGNPADSPDFIVASPGIAAPFTGTLPDPADVTQDGIVDVNDIIRLVDLTLSAVDASCPENSSIFSPCVGDVNGDGDRSVLDINAIVTLLVLTGP